VRRLSAPREYWVSIYNTSTARVFVRAVIVFACCFTTINVPASAQSNNSVRNFVERLNSASMALLNTKSTQDARKKCRHLLAWAFDVRAMARIALGDAWPKATDSERRGFYDAFENGLVRVYVRRVEANRGMTLLFVGTRPQSGGHQLAATRMIFPEKPERTWIWRLRPSGRSWRVIDVLTNGASLLQAERRKYARVLEANKGRIDALIEFIRSRNN
jgi:ABC-type transporter MlaC component